MELHIGSLLFFLHAMSLQHPVSGTRETVYISTKSEVRFYSDAPLEDIEATSTALRSAMTMETGQLLFVMPMNSFEFEKALMQKHYNEQYLETDKYPEARFEGNLNESPVELNGTKVIPYEGLLTMHGVSRNIRGMAELTRKGNIIYGKSSIIVRLADYDIKIPRMVIRNIAEVVEVTIKVEFHLKNIP